MDKNSSDTTEKIYKKFDDFSEIYIPKTTVLIKGFIIDTFSEKKYLYREMAINLISQSITIDYQTCVIKKIKQELSDNKIGT